MGVVGPGARRFRLAQGGNCKGPLIRRRRTFTASGTTVGGMNPGQATEPGSSSKIVGLVSPLKPARARPGHSTRQGPQPGQTLRPGKARRPGLSNWRRAAEPGTTKASPTSRPHPWRAPQSNHGSIPVPSRPYDGTRPQSPMTMTTVFPPMPMVSRSVATVPLTYPLTGAGVAIMLPPTPVTAESGNLTERTVRDSTRPCPDDRQDGAQSP